MSHGAPHAPHHSPHWHRVAALRPQLSLNARLRRQRLRGQTWYLLTDPVGGRSVRLNAAAYAVAGRLDGRCTVEQLWDALQELPGEPCSQVEMIDLLVRLREASLVRFDRPADFAQLLPHLARSAAPKPRPSLLAWRVPLGNPTALLDRLLPWAGRLFSGPAFALWALAVGWLVFSAAQQLPALWASAQRSLAAPQVALLALVLYVPIKLLHELAHGLAVRRWGGAVREAGVTLMLLLPVPYVDASAAAAFASKTRRVGVGAAGVMAELALAAVAMAAWLHLPDGLARDAAFVTLVITGVSTLVFNANPLQRLDGYYVLSDALELPNLAPRSRAWWLDLLRRRLLRSDDEPMALARGERAWLAAYAPLAWGMSGVVAALAVLWLGTLSFALGLVAAALLGWQTVLRPPWRLARQLRRAALAQPRSARRWGRLAWGTLAALGLALVVPLPQRVVAQGVVWPPEAAQLRADEDGFVREIAATDGQAVEAGDVVLQLDNPKLRAERDGQATRVTALETEFVQSQRRDRSPRAGADARAGDARAELTAAQAQLARLDERLDALAVRARTAGRVALPHAADLPGGFVRGGTLLGQVLTDAPATVRVALPESQAAELRRLQPALSARLAASPAQVHAATLLRDGGAAVAQLPSAALGTRHGGSVATDPQDASGLEPLQPVVLLDVALTEAGTPRGAERMGERAWVRFDAGYRPLAWRWASELQRVARQRFHPQY